MTCEWQEGSQTVAPVLYKKLDESVKRPSEWISQRRRRKGVPKIFHVVIIGGRQSAAHEIAEMFDKLKDVCKGVSSVVQEYRNNWWMLIRNSTTHCLIAWQSCSVRRYRPARIFDALLSTDIGPTTNLLSQMKKVIHDNIAKSNHSIRTVYHTRVDTDNEVRRTQMTPEERLKAREALTKRINDQMKTEQAAPYMFVRTLELGQQKTLHGENRRGRPARIRRNRKQSDRRRKMMDLLLSVYRPLNTQRRWRRKPRNSRPVCLGHTGVDGAQQTGCTRRPFSVKI